MITSNDLILLLTDIQEHGENVDSMLMEVMSNTGRIPEDVLKFFNDRRPLDVTCFYDLLRNNYNHHKSELYRNIMKEIDDPDEVIVTLGALNLQIELYGRKLANRKMFFEHSRANEIIRVLGNYYATFDITEAMKLLKLIKADNVVLETVSGHRKKDTSAKAVERS